MRIHNQGAPGVPKIYEQQKKVVSANQIKPQAKDDGVELSSEARLFSVAWQALHELPQAEGKNLEQVKEALQKGTYQVNNDAVAEAIWQESMLNEKA